MAELSSNYNALECKLDGITAAQKQILKVTDSLTKKAEGINTAAKGIEDKVTKVNDMAAQIADSTRTYCDVLLAQPSHPLKTLDDLKLKDVLERKAKQILMEVHSDDLSRKSTTEIKSKAERIIAEMDDELDCPENVEVDFVTITQTKVILMQMNTKQAADWLKDPHIEFKFVAEFAKNSYFVDRTYSIVVPWVPITFDPKDTKHL